MQEYKFESEIYASDNAKAARILFFLMIFEQSLIKVA